jgi:hypothetical protein
MGFSTVCFHSPEAFWSQKLAQKPILSLQQKKCQIDTFLEKEQQQQQQQHTHSLLRPPVRD